MVVGSNQKILQTKQVPVASLNLLEFKVLEAEVPTESLTWWRMLMLTKHVTKVGTHLEQECWFFCVEGTSELKWQKLTLLRYLASWGPLMSLEVLSDKYFMQDIEKRLLQNLLKYKDYHLVQQASDQAQCEWVCLRRLLQAEYKILGPRFEPVGCMTALNWKPCYCI